MRSRRSRFAAVALGLVLAGAATPAVLAQEADEGAPRLVLRAVDASDPEAPKVVVSYGGDDGDLDDVTVTIDGVETDADLSSPADAGISNDIVFVLDTSESTDADGLLSEAKAVIGAFVANLPAGSRVAVIGAGAVGQTLQRFTADPVEVVDALDEAAPEGQGGLRAGISLASGLINRAVRTGSIGTVVVFTDGAPEESIEIDVVRGQVLDAGAVLHVVALSTEGFDGGAFRTLSDSSEGSLTIVEEVTDVEGAFEALVPELNQMVVATVEGRDERGVRDLAVTVGDSRATGSFVAGGTLVGPNRLFDRPGVEPTGPGFLRSDAGRYLAYGGVLLASVLLCFGLALIFIRDDTGLNAALQPYSEGYVAREDEEAGEGNQAMAQTAFLKRAVDATESFAESQGFLTRIERTLEKADIPLRAGEAMFFYLAVVLLVLVAGFALIGNALGALVVTLIGGMIPPSVVNFRATRKKKKFEALLPDTLQLLSSTLRAGYSMMQGVEAVSTEAAEPMGKELRRVVTEARLGRPLEESLDGVADRMESADFGWAVMAIRIQREVGGNLSELLMTVAETMTERERLRRDINSLTAEGRISAYVLGGLPIALGGALYVINPDYIGKLFEVTSGQIALGAAILMMGIGFAWMFKIIKIEL